MADKRNESDEQEERPKINVVDRRMLSEEERAGAGPEPQIITPDAAGGASERPHLEIIDGGRADNGLDEDDELTLEDAGEDDDEADGLDGLTEEEQEQLQAELEQLEQEQFAALEQRAGRPLTEQEKNAVRAQMRAQMEEQARSAAALEIAPVLQQMMGEMHARATIHMGLMPNPYTQIVARNDAEARLAIDTFAALLELIRPRMEPAAAKEFDRVLNDLRVNFVTITGTPMGGPSRIIH